MSLHDSPLLQEHKHLVNERIKEISEPLINGKCSTLEEYKKKTGQINGLKQSLELMTQAIKAYANDDDEE